MVIANLNYLDAVSNESKIIGGDALAVATSGAFAFGRNTLAATGTNTLAIDFGRRRPSLAAARSVSISAAS
jgi:hypothetical protein